MKCQLKWFKVKSQDNIINLDGSFSEGAEYNVESKDSLVLASLLLYEILIYKSQRHAHFWQQQAAR